MTEKTKDEEWLSAGEAAKRFGGITTKTLRSILEEEAIPVVNLKAGNFRILAEDIDRLFEARYKPLT